MDSVDVTIIEIYLITKTKEKNKQNKKTVSSITSKVKMRL